MDFSDVYFIGFLHNNIADPIPLTIHYHSTIFCTCQQGCHHDSVTEPQIGKARYSPRLEQNSPYLWIAPHIVKYNNKYFTDLHNNKM